MIIFLTKLGYFYRKHNGKLQKSFIGVNALLEVHLILKYQNKGTVLVFSRRPLDAFHHDPHIMNHCIK